MGRPACGGPTPSDHVSTLYFPTVLSAFPSPAASVNASLDSPTLTSILSRSQVCPEPAAPRDGFFHAARVVPAEPDVIKLESIMTPPAEERSEPDLNLVVGGALNPNPPTSLSASLTRNAHDLRLPSFERLGIAAPHPDRLTSPAFGASDSGVERSGLQRHSSAPCGGYDFAPTSEDVRIAQHSAINLTDPRFSTPPKRPIHSPIPHYNEPLTPPHDEHDMDWNLAIGMQALAVHSPSADPGEATGGAEQVGTPAEGTTVGGGLVAGYITNDGEEEADTHWSDGALSVIIHSLRLNENSTASVKILSHALPSPSGSGHVFPKVIDDISKTTPASPISPMTWINVFHAIPGRFSLSDIPSSPPNTPGPAIGGDDYFTQKVFESAVVIADYQRDQSFLPRSPAPVVQPSSIDISIVERFIPPSSSNEFAQMFDLKGPSILIDRLVELSPDQGSLLFIYPTKTGAQTFMKEYLSPLLDRLLRSIVVANDLSSELSRTLGVMSAVDELLEHDALEHRVNALCARLTQQSTAVERFHGRRPTFSVAYAQKKRVMLGREAWARHWWTKQEKLRVREGVTKFVQEKQRKGASEHGAPIATSTELVQELLEGVATKKAYEQGDEPKHGVEVSVFVIQRTA